MLPTETEGSSPEDVTVDDQTMVADPAQEADTDAKTPAESSTADAQDANQGPRTPLEAVEKAMAEEAAAKTEKSSDSDGQPKSEGDGADGEAADGNEPAKAESGKDGEGESEDDPPPFHEHPRWKEMVGERDQYREQAEILQPKAEVYDQIIHQLDEAGITDEEFNSGLHIMGLMKTDPAAALEALKPYFQNLQQFTGDLLSPELQEAVDAGEMTEERAREFQRVQAQNTFTQQRQEASVEERDRQAAESHRSAIAQAADNWFNDKASTDPDWPLKEALVEAYAARALKANGGPPKDTAGVKAMMDGVMKEVDDHLKKLRPDGPKPTPRSPDMGAASPDTRSTPTNPLEVVEQALERA